MRVVLSSPYVYVGMIMSHPLASGESQPHEPMSMFFLDPNRDAQCKYSHNIAPQ